MLRFKIYAVIAAILAGIVTMGYMSWKNSIKQEALLEYNKEQLEQVVKENKKLNENLKAIEQNQKQLLEDMQKRNDQLADQLRDLDKYLSSDQAQKDSRPSSNVLKNTIRELSKVK